ncbi:DUF2695 domain-containing protein [Desulfosediminicola sp.]|uniref:DUF2695 domain-containing protein n=1 Tax=Desulfosediminicola sp. TaxID=2886825 RepID=UPI003AF273D6
MHFSIKKILKAKFKQQEQQKLLDSLPMEIAQLKELLSYLNREDAPACDHTLKETLHFLRTHSLEVDNTVNWLNEHGGYCDCEVIYNVYDEVGDIVDWHLDAEDVQNTSTM